MENDISLESAAAAEAPRVRLKAPVIAGKPDKHIWGIYIFLCLISTIELYSASSREVSAAAQFGVLGPVVRHIIFLLIGLGIMLFMQSRHYSEFRRFTYVFALISVGMMLYVNFFGDVINGARRSMTLFGFQIQPAEFIKLAAVTVVSLIMARNQMAKGIGVTDRGIWASAIWVLIFGGLLARQGLTNTVLLMAISLSMMLIGGVAFRKMGVVLLAYAACGGIFVLYLGLSPSKDDKAQMKTELTVARADDGSYHTREVTVGDADGEKGGRLQTWINRLSRYGDDAVPKYKQKIDALNRQEMYSYFAQAHGGVTGVGPGNSREASRLPLAFSDFIYSIVVEEWGLVGGLVLLVLYLWLLARASSVASRCSRAYPALLVLGIAVMIVLQALAHMAITVGAAPVSGQPLPLISKGGSSIIITSIAFGMMLSVSRHAVRHRSRKTEIKQEIEALPEDLRAENPTQL